ncbi:DUF883 family protein [Pseudomonas sp. LRF_L74]|uniref:DUF883 family protein n=1 Tax=Pseudomonas sp. LRF_L74 TaxID=3369422 RepID=UPI003F620D4B
MAIFTRNNEKKALHSIETEIEHLIQSLDTLKSEVGEESQKSLKSLRGSAERALGHSRQLLGTAYEEVKEKTVRAGIATRDYSREHPVASASIGLGVVALIGYLIYRNRE